MLALMKGFTGFGAIIILLVGLGMTGITIYGYFHPELFLNDLSQRNIILGILIGSDIAIILGSIIGIAGIKKGNGGCICIFQLIVIIFMLIFAGIGISAVLLPRTVFDGDCSSSSNPMVKVASEMYVASVFTFCQAGCSCWMPSPPFDLGTYNQTELDFIKDNFVFSPNGGFLQTQSCIKGNPEQQSMMAVLNSLQTWLDCSLWCQQSNPYINLIYRFSDIRNGKPKQYCYPAIKDSLTSYGQLVGIAALSTFGFLLLLCICNLGICCHPTRRDLPFKERFSYVYRRGDDRDDYRPMNR